MGKLLTVITSLTILTGCANVESNTRNSTCSRCDTVYHEGCEYVTYRVSNGAGITHKANCDNPIHKN